MGTFDDSKASAAASGAARSLASRELTKLKTDVEMKRSRAEILLDRFPDTEQGRKDGDMVLDAIEDDEVSDETVLQWLTDREWDPARPGRCWLRSFGGWVGRPLSYDVVTTLRGEETERQVREITPEIAFGVGYTPHAYFSLLLGVTFASVDSLEGPRSVRAGTIAIGGNLDLLAALLGK